MGSMVFAPVTVTNVVAPPPPMLIFIFAPPGAAQSAQQFPLVFPQIHPPLNVHIAPPLHVQIAPPLNVHITPPLNVNVSLFGASQQAGGAPILVVVPFMPPLIPMVLVILPAAGAGAQQAAGFPSLHFTPPLNVHIAPPMNVHITPPMNVQIAPPMNVQIAPPMNVNVSLFGGSQQAGAAPILVVVPFMPPLIPMVLVILPAAGAGAQQAAGFPPLHFTPPMNVQIAPPMNVHITPPMNVNVSLFGASQQAAGAPPMMLVILPAGGAGAQQAAAAPMLAAVAVWPFIPPLIPMVLVILPAAGAGAQQAAGAAPVMVPCLPSAPCVIVVFGTGGQ